MEIFSSAFLDVFFQLVPGFIASWVFYGLTPIGKPDQLDRIINALIYSTLIKIVIFIYSKALFIIGENYFSLGVWSVEIDLLSSVILAFLFGIFLSYSTNHDNIHSILRKLKITMADSYPSQWYEEMIKNNSYVLLTLKDGRRVYGYPIEPAEAPDKGHFILSPYIWLTDNDDNDTVSLEIKTDPAEKQENVQSRSIDPLNPDNWNLSKILVASSMVEFVELIPEDE